MKKLVLFVLLMFCLNVYSQNTLEFCGGAGYTIVDVEKIVDSDEVSGTFATDWGQFSSNFSAAYFFYNIGQFNIGAEIMYQKLYWYSVSVPFGNQPIYRTYHVSTTKITPVARLGVIDNVYFDIGPEFNFSDGVKMGLLLSLGVNFAITEKFEIPVKFRTDIISGIALRVPISFQTGIVIKM